MTAENDPDVVRTVYTRTGRDEQDRQRAQKDQASEQERVTEKYREFIAAALEGKLPDPGKVEPLDPAVGDLLSDLAILHLPEWTNSTGRKLADAVVFTLPSAARIAAYLVERGWRRDLTKERIRWTPTPGGLTAPHDLGLHIRPDPETGEWPAPDPEQYWDVDDIQTSQLPDGTWKSEHPRGLAFQAASKSEALAGITERIREKIEEASTDAG